MKTLLVGINAKFIHTNLAIRYLYTYTRNHHDISFVEFTIKDTSNHIVNEILKDNPQLIGFSCYIWNIELIKSVVKLIKEKSPEVKILLGGPEVSYDIDWFNDLPIDYIIFGEGEYSFKLLLNALEKNEPLNNIPQLHYRHNQKIYTNNAEYSIDLNTLPTPYRLEEDLPTLASRIQYIETSRGCPYHCSYCLASLEKKVRFFDQEFIKSEIMYLMDNGAKVFKFLDRTFNIRRDYALDIFKFIINNHKVGCVFQFEITGDLLDEEIISYLNKEAPPHLIRFEIGVQSTNDDTNKTVLRKQNYAKLKHNIECIQKGQKIDLHLDLIAGLPKEDYKAFVKSFNDVFALQPHELQLGFLKLLRGTKLRQEASLYQYHFQEKAPYEVIKHGDLAENDIRKIHAAEDILEKYYNSHRFNSSITYIIKFLYKNNNYQFFEDFGLFYQKHYPSIGYQLHDLYIRLIKFCEYKNFDSTLIESLLIYDYLKNAKTRPKIFYQKRMEKKEKNRLRKIIQEKTPFSLDFLYRYSILELLTINPLTYEQKFCYVLKIFNTDNNDLYLFEKDNL